MLLEKHFSIGIISRCLAIIASLLYGRKLFVDFRTVLVAIKSGIPQRVIGSTVSFNIFVRNLPSIILFAKLFQCADDCFKLYYLFS
jgi:hypothetical protein